MFQIHFDTGSFLSQYSKGAKVGPVLCLFKCTYLDTEGLMTQSVEGAQMGFTGKQCIHPLQVPIVQQAFSPSQEKVEWANALVEAFNQHSSSGKV